MSIVCRSFRQNAWKKDLCSDCFKPENDHVDVCVSSNGQKNLINSTDWNGKVQSLQSTKANLSELRKPTNGSTNSFNNKVNNHVNSNSYNNNNRKKTNPTTTSTVNTMEMNSENNIVSNGDIVNGKVAILNQRNLDKSDDLFETVKSTINGTNHGKHMVIKSNSAPIVTTTTKIVGILKVKNDSGDQSRKGSVKFSVDPIVIGYCDDEDSGNEESEEELDYCDYKEGDDDDYSEEDSEFSRLTALNTRFNSIGANLRDAKNLQTFGQINNQSNGIAFRIGDFKSETRKHEYDDTLIGCNRVSELIGEEKRGKLTNGSNFPTTTTTTTNGINGLSSSTSVATTSMATITTTTTTTATNNSNNNHQHKDNHTNNNGKSVIEDEVTINSNGGSLVNNNGQEESNNKLTTTNGKQEDHQQVNDNIKKCVGNQINNTIKGDKSSSTLPSSLPINCNVVVNSSSGINSSSSSTTTSQGQLSSTFNTTTTNNSNNLSTSTITHNCFVTSNAGNNFISEKDEVNDTSSFSSSTINCMTNGGTLNSKSTSQAKINHHNETIKVTQQQLTTPSISSTTTINTINTSSLSSTPIVSVAPMKSESITVNVTSTLKNKSNYLELSEEIDEIKSDCQSVSLKITNNKTDLTDGQLIVTSLPITNTTQFVDNLNGDSGVNMKSISETTAKTNDKVIDEMIPDINKSSPISVNYEVENELSSSSSDENNEIDGKDVKSMNDETESIDYPVDDIDDCSSSTIDITDDVITTTNSTISIPDDDTDDKNDRDDNDDKVNDAVLTSSVSLTLTTRINDYDDDNDSDSDISEERSVESIDVSTTINNQNNSQTNQIEGKINSINFDTDEKTEIPKKPERSLKSSLKPKIPCKPLSLSNKVNEDDTIYGNGIDLMINTDNCNNKHYEVDYYRQTDSMVDQFVQSKSEFNPITWNHVNYSNNHNNQHQSSRELRLAELAQELESVRHPGKRQAPVNPSGSSGSSGSSSSSSTSSASSTTSSASSPLHEVYDRPVRYNTISRSNLPAPPPRPPPPSSGLKHIVNGVTNGSNLFHSNGNKDKESSGGTKFSLKKLLKLSKDDNDLEHNGETISGKTWKHKFDLDRRKSSPGHNQYHLNEPDRSSTSGSYEVNKSIYSTGRERSYSLSGNSCLSQSQQQQLLIQQQQQQLKSTNGFRPIVPARRSRSSDINAQNNSHKKNNSSESTTLNRYNPIASPSPSSSITNGSSSNKSIINGSSSQLTISPVCSPINGHNISSPSPPSISSSSSSSSTSPLPRSTSKLTSPSDLILTNLNLDSAYTVIAKYNVDTINRILHNYSICHQSYKNISKKDLFYESFRLIGSEAKIYKDAYLKSETISANFLVTPLAYSVRSETSVDLQYGQFIDSDENIKLFALKPEFDLILTLDRLLDEDFTELTGNLSPKSAAFIILQAIGLLKYYQANGIEEINEEKLKLTMLCCNKKQLTNNIYFISPPFDYVSNVTNRDHSNSSPSMSLCKCVKLLVKNLRRKLIKSDDVINYLEEILDDDKVSTLSIAKTICEMILFEVPWNFESPGTLELWLDIQRTKFINLLNYENETESMSQKTVHNYYFMLFLTRSNINLLFQCINQIRVRLLNQLY